MSFEAERINSLFFENYKLLIGAEWPDIFEKAIFAELFHILIILSSPPVAILFPSAEKIVELI